MRRSRNQTQGNRLDAEGAEVLAKVAKPFRAFFGANLRVLSVEKSSRKRWRCRGGSAKLTRQDLTRLTPIHGKKKPKKEKTCF